LLNDLESVKTELISQSDIQIGDFCRCKRVTFRVEEISIVNTSNGLQYFYTGVKVFTKKATYKQVAFLMSDIEHIEKLGV
jgi:hypothetical protein